MNPFLYKARLPFDSRARLRRTPTGHLCRRRPPARDTYGDTYAGAAVKSRVFEWRLNAFVNGCILTRCRRAQCAGVPPNGDASMASTKTLATAFAVTVALALSGLQSSVAQRGAQSQNQGIRGVPQPDQSLLEPQQPPD